MSAAITLEGFIGAGTGGDLEGAGLFGACLSIDLDYYSRFDLPHGRPFRCDDGSTWRGRARLGRRRSASLGRLLPPAERERIGLAYLDDALDEHASVPAFERLAVELALHRAPRSLVARALGAAAEEIRHARTCFALAAAYLGRDIRAPSLPYPGVRRARALPEDEPARRASGGGGGGAEARLESPRHQRLQTSAAGAARGACAADQARGPRLGGRLRRAR